MNETTPDRATLRILTTDPEPPDNLVVFDVPACTGAMTCPCPACQAERFKLVRRGVRASTPLPIRRAA